MNNLSRNLRSKFQLWNKILTTQNNIFQIQQSIRAFSAFKEIDISQQVPKKAVINGTEDSLENLAKEVAKGDMPVEMINPYERDRKVCILCKYGIKLDYKNPKLLSQFVSPYTGQLYDQHITRLCSKQQLLVKQEILRSIRAGYMAVMVKSVEFLKDPPLFDPNHPIKPHKY